MLLTKQQTLLRFYQFSLYIYFFYCSLSGIFLKCRFYILYNDILKIIMIIYMYIETSLSFPTCYPTPQTSS